MSTRAAGVIFVLCALCCPVWGMANPAAVYCEDLGYAYRIEHGPNGDTGFCQVGVNKSYPSWDFILGKQGEAYNYCGKMGYGTRVLPDVRCRYGLECAFCVLPDGQTQDVLRLMEKEKTANETGQSYPQTDTSWGNYLIYVLAVPALIFAVFAVRFLRRNK